VLEHCRQQAGEPGIKAILIYPMNALATDQAKRIAALIHQHPSLRNKITAGLYVGDKEDQPTSLMTADRVITDKQILRDSPPDILLTNYKMLDYLLIQPESQNLWKQNQPDTLRYLVVDEFHTFDGAQGTDLACLLRRLKHRLNIPPKHLACVGTSATLGSDPSSTGDMLDYATTIFGEPFEPNAIIAEDRITPGEFFADAMLDIRDIPSPMEIDRLRPDYYTSPAAYVRGQATLWLDSPETDDSPIEETWCLALGEQLKTLPVIQNIIRKLQEKNYSYSDLLSEIGRLLRFPKSDQPEYQNLLLDSLFSLIATARRSIQKPDGQLVTVPWVTLRVQIWLRELKRMVATVSPIPKLVYSDDLSPDESKSTLPIVHCRTCGATGWAGVKHSQADHRLTQNDLKKFYREFFAHRPTVAFIFPGRPDVSPHDQYAPHHQLCSQCFTINGHKATNCKYCNHDQLISVYIPVTTASETHQNEKRDISSSDCPFCHSNNGLSILGAQAASLTSAMIGVLYTSSFNTDKKLLTFSDSVQDAAHRAGFYGARTYNTTLRTAIAEVVAAQPTGSSLEHLVTKFPNYWQQKFTTVADYVATFLPTYLEWLREWDGFIQGDTVDLPPDTPLINLVNERLQWEIISQFGHRSTIGPSLERSAVCAAYFEVDLLKQATATLHQWLSNEIEVLRQVPLDLVQQFLLGILHHLRQRGGIFQPAPAMQQYINAGGNTFVLQKPLYMPRLGPTVPAPIFLVNATAKTDRFERVMETGQRSSWCNNWVWKHFSQDQLILTEQVIEILHQTLSQLEAVGLLATKDCGQGRAWGIPLAEIKLTSISVALCCDRCGHQLTTTDQQNLAGMLCLSAGCLGHYQVDVRGGLPYYQEIYRTGQVKRIVAAEHTGLLTRDQRERLEQRFINSDRRCDPNLLSATSTLEMGINIGDLSTVMLCSVPPGVANFQQRIGRAGRRDGNALVGTVANGQPHDLFFYDDPYEMMSGNIDAAGCYIDDSAILRRQLTAFCLDSWVKTGISKRDFPTELSYVFNAIDKSDQRAFPYNWLQFIKENQGRLLEDFLAMFADQFKDSNLTSSQIRQFMEEGELNEGGLSWHILDRLTATSREYKRLNSQIRTISDKIKKLKEQPAALVQADAELKDQLEREKSSLSELMKSIRKKHVLNFLTDEGLLPNYAFPEAGVTLRSILWRKYRTEQQNGKKYETFTLSYERPGSLAIRELVPSGVFYAEGRKVKIDQIDLKLSEPADWRICRSCSYTTLNTTEIAQLKTCPRCGDNMWQDSGRIRRMLRLKQVMASTSDKNSRFGDDSDERSPAFFERHLSVDFEPESCEETFLVSDKEFPFGFEYIAKANFREINLGASANTGSSLEMAGRKYSTQGFKVCRDCGKVMQGNSTEHAITCKFRTNPDRAKFEDVLYLYREFPSETVRLLMPDEQFWSDQGMDSFIAALQLGLKLKFRGKVDHLRTTISDEPQPNSALRKSFLYLYDSVPGGTGYLRQLVRSPNEFKDVFDQSLAVLRACECEDGCYKCLFAYRNSSTQNRTSRKTAVNLLVAINKHWQDLQPTEKKLSTIQVNSNFESKLESLFIDAIRRYPGKVYGGTAPTLRKEIINGRSGYHLKVGEMLWTIELQVNLDRNEGIEHSSRADFVFRPASVQNLSKPIVVFTDGWEYHQDRLGKDFLQRLAILRSHEYWCWSLAWDDVDAQINPDKIIDRAEGLTCQVNPVMASNLPQIYNQYQCSELQPLESLNSFEWLMRYLAAPEDIHWQNWAMLRTVVQANSAALQDSDIRSSWQSQIDKALSESVLDNWPLPGNFLCQTIKVDENIQLWIAADPARHQSLNSEGSLMLLSFSDSGSHLRRSWIETLRLLNLYQFLPHCYFITDDTSVEILDLIAPSAFISNFSPPEHPQAWDEIRGLADERLLVAIDQMQQENWSLPEVGYELLDKQGSMAELWWPNAQIAVVIENSDQQAFMAIGCKALLIEEFLQSINEIGNQLLGGK
jgi:DEAD/DEAH box helicase domain-containing protein